MSVWFAMAQIVSAPFSTDTSALATKAQLDAVQAQAAAALSNACPAASVVPPLESVGGAAGSAATCRRSDAVQPRITRAGTVVTDLSGNWSVTWTVALSSIPVVLPVPVDGGTQPIMCTVSTRTNTGATGRCFRAQLLPSTLTLLSALVSYNVFGGAAAGSTVQILAIPMTQ